MINRLIQFISPSHSIIFVTIFLTACGLTTTRPKLEMSMAANAYIAAKDAKAPTLAPNLFRQAETYYLKAKSAYRRKYFNKAKQYAIMSKNFSEKAEFEALRKKTLQSTEEF